MKFGEDQLLPMHIRAAKPALGRAVRICARISSH